MKEIYENPLKYDEGYQRKIWTDLKVEEHFDRNMLEKMEIRENRLKVLINKRDK
jgi:hypothetical protein